MLVCLNNKWVLRLLVLLSLCGLTTPAAAVIVLNGRAPQQTWILTNVNCVSLASMDTASRAAYAARQSRAMREAGSSGRMDWCPQVVGLHRDRYVERGVFERRVAPSEHAARARGYRLGD